MRWLVASVLVMASVYQARAGETDSLRLAQTIPLDGVEGRIDHMVVDAKAQRLYIAALGNNTVEIVDLKAGKQVGRISGLRKPQGLAILPESNRLVVASGGDGKVRVYDENQKLLGTVEGLDDADNVRYDTEAKLIYVGYGEGALAVIYPRKIEKIAEIKLDGHPESFQMEAKGHRIFVNLPDSKQISVIDRERRSVVAKWPLREAEANFPMAMDDEHHRLFLGCRKPATLVVLDSETGKVVESLDCCGDTDDVFYDAARKRIYVSGGEGCVSIFGEGESQMYKLAAKAITALGARTSLFVPATGQLLVAVPHRDSQRAEIRVFVAEINVR